MKATVRNISELISASGLSCYKLSERSGYGESSFRNWKDGSAIPSLTAAADILEVLGYELVIKKVNEDD